MPGRGAWPTNGAGGTKQYKDRFKPGPYYFIGTGTAPQGRARTADEYAVWRAVIAIQTNLNRAMGTNLTLDGVFGEVTSDVVYRFQQANVEKTGTPWGGVGPDSAKAILLPVAQDAARRATHPEITLDIITGITKKESVFDPGAVGYQDPDDLGLAMINGRSHPDLSPADRLRPATAFRFIVDYLENAMAQLDNNIRDAIISYNLGIGGARVWIRAGRPSEYRPTPDSAIRYPNKYIDDVLAG